MLVAAAVLAVWGFGQLAAGRDRLSLCDVERLAAGRGTGGDRAGGIRGVFRASRGAPPVAAMVCLVRIRAQHRERGGLLHVIREILWLFPSPYPDVWGPFLSRNNFAQFLELAFPVALWLACTWRGTLYMWMSATMLACGLVSASRAGAVLLIVEAAAVFALARPPAPRRLIPLFAAGVMVLAALAGGEVLVHRLQDSDPFRDRREIFASSLAMIAARPWTGYGLGNFATVYPEFARFDPGAVVEHAHNDWLEWATEGGWPYAAAWMLLAISALRPALRSIWGIGVPAIFVHALVDYPFARFGVAAWLFILVGALESKGRSE